MIELIRLRDFRGFREAEIRPSRITLLIGRNGTGKSSMLQAPMLLRQSRRDVTRLNTDGENVTLPGMNLVRRTTAPERNVEISLGGRNDPRGRTPVRFQAHLEYDAQGALVRRGGFTEFTREGITHRVSQEPEATELETDRGTVSYRKTPEMNGFAITAATGGENPNDRAWFRAARAPGEILAGVRMTPAVRGFTRSVHTMTENEPGALSLRYGPPAMERDLASAITYSKPETERASELMRRVVGVGIRAKIVLPWSVRIVTETDRGERGINEDGSGAGTLAQPLFELARTKPHETLIIEEPEMRLHPRAQAKLVQALVEEAVDRDLQVIVTTHSEHVAGRALTLAAEGRLAPEDLSIHLFEKDGEGICACREVRVTERGQVEGGLPGFFEHEMAEMRRYVDALRRRE